MSDLALVAANSLADGGGAALVASGLAGRDRVVSTGRGLRQGGDGGTKDGEDGEEEGGELHLDGCWWLVVDG